MTSDLQSTSEPGRVSRADVYVGLLELCSRYCFLFDSSDADGLADCFTPDGIFEIVGRSLFAGRPAIAELVRSTAAIRPYRPRHSYQNLWVTFTDGFRASAKASFSLLDPVSGENAGFGNYEDDATLCPDGLWRWARRRVFFIWDAGAGEPKPGDPDW